MTGLDTYVAVDERESLLSILKDVSPNLDNYFVTNLAKGSDALQPIHQWGVYNTARPTSVTAEIEGFAATYTDLATPTKSTNYTAIVKESVRVSGTERATSNITKEDPMVFQKDKALKRLKANMEFLTINGSAAAGATDTARGMAGFDKVISTNVTARASGTSFTETELNDILQDSYDQVGSEYIADLILCPMVIKRRIATSFTNNTRVIDAAEKRMNGEIRVYDSPVGQTVKIIPHKDVRKVAGSLTVYALREELYQHSFLKGREPMWKEMAVDGDRENGMYLTEFTLVSFAQLASAKRTGYATTL